MSIKTTTAIYCDRCEKLIRTVDGDGEDASHSEHTVDVRAFGGRPVEFFDLCEKCTGRVKDLIGQIALTKPEKAEEPGE